MWPMSIGTGIFLGSLALALVVLFLGTKDRWRWRRIIFFTTATVVVVGLGFAGAISYFGGPLEGPLDSIWDIHLGDSKADVLFAKGGPPAGGPEFTREEILGEMVRRGLISTADAEAQAGSAEEHLTYTPTEAAHRPIIQISFDATGKVGKVTYRANFQRLGEPKLADVGIGASLQEVTATFGEPQVIHESPDSLGRIFVYAAPAIFFELEKGSVVRFGIYDPAYGVGHL